MKREPKSIHSTNVKIVGRPGGKKGSIQMNSGYFSYSRNGAHEPNLKLTYQQLIDLLEKEIEYRSIDVAKLKLPRPHPDGDLSLQVWEVDKDGVACGGYFKSTFAWRKLDGRRIDEGAYQFTPDMASGKQSKKYDWFARISVQAALWIIHRYIEKYLVSKKFTYATSGDIVISKKEMHRILSIFLKRIAP